MTFAIVFPPPPPTANTLTSRQRAQLLRKTKKLERVLGTAPRLIDTPHIGEPRSPKTRSLSRYSDYSSLSSTSSFSSSHSRQSSSASLLSTRSSRVASKVLDDFYKMNLPVLRLSVQPSESLDTIPASPTSSTCSSPSEDSDPRFVLRPNTDVAEPDYPSFTIPTNNTLRRQKLERLRRKLGDGIPLDLVFPDDDDSDDAKSQTSTCSPVTKALPPLPRHSERKITSARDSIIVMTSPNRPGYRIKRKPVPKIVASRPAPPPPSPSPPPYSQSVAASIGAKTPQTSSIVGPHERIAKTRLSLILESPDEHANTVIEEMEVSLLSTKWRRSYDFDASGWFEDSAVWVRTDLA